jgi:hypothetical protein
MTMNFLRGILIHGFSLKFYLLWKDGFVELSQPPPTYIEKGVIFIKLCAQIMSLDFIPPSHFIIHTVNENNLQTAQNLRDFGLGSLLINNFKMQLGTSDFVKDILHKYTCKLV